MPATGEANEPFVVIGPAGPVGAMVRGAMRHVVETLAELVLANSRLDAGGRDRLTHAAEAAVAWVRTYSDAQAVEDFSFDTQRDLE